MAKLISTAPLNVDKFEIGSKIYWTESIFDGRIFESKVFYGTVVKVNPKTVDVKTKTGSIYRVDKEELNLFNVNELFD